MSTWPPRTASAAPVDSCLAVPSGGVGSAGCVVAYSAMPNSFRLNITLDPKANEGFEVIGAVEYSSYAPPNVQEGLRYRSKSCSGSVKTGEKSRLRSNPKSIESSSSCHPSPAQLNSTQPCPALNSVRPGASRAVYHPVKRPVSDCTTFYPLMLEGVVDKPGKTRPPRNHHEIDPPRPRLRGVARRSSALS
jgi:hypothetical protein